MGGLPGQFLSACPAGAALFPELLLPERTGADAIPVVFLQRPSPHGKPHPSIREHLKPGEEAEQPFPRPEPSGRPAEGRTGCH